MKNIRSSISNIDEQIFSLLKERMLQVEKIQSIKHSENLPFYQVEQENLKRTYIKKHFGEAYLAIFSEIISIARSQQDNVKFVVSKSSYAQARAYLGQSANLTVLRTAEEELTTDSYLFLSREEASEFSFILDSNLIDTNFFISHYKDGEWLKPKPLV